MISRVVLAVALAAALAGVPVSDVRAQDHADIDDGWIGPRTDSSHADSRSEEWVARFVPSTETEFGHYATSVLAAGSDVFIGWPGRQPEPRGERKGAVEWARRVSGRWQSSLLQAPPGNDVRYFGYSLTSVGSTLFVTSLENVHVYDRTGNSWVFRSSIADSIAGMRFTGPLHSVGEDWVAAKVRALNPITGWEDEIALLRRTGSAWTLHSRLEHSGTVRDVCSTGGELAVLNGRIQVIPGDSTFVEGIELFGFDGERWTRTNVLVSSPEIDADVGSHLACGSDVIVTPSARSAVFQRTTDAWVEESYLPAPDDILVVGGGMHGEYLYLVQCENVVRDGSSAEEFYIRTLRRVGGRWELTDRIDSFQRLRPGSEPDNGAFGRSMSFSDDWMVVAAPYRTVDDGVYGEAYVYPIEVADRRRFLAPEPTLHGPVLQALSLTSVFPNPATSGANLRLSLPEAVRVDVSLYDALGRTTSRLDSRVMDAGTTDLKISTSNLAAGNYLIRVCIDGNLACANRSMLVIR